MTKRERELTDAVQRLEAADARMRAEYARYDQALNELMRDVLREVVIDYNVPTSIACRRLIEAVRKASQTVHDRQANR